MPKEAVSKEAAFLCLLDVYRHLILTLHEPLCKVYTSNRIDKDY